MSVRVTKKKASVILSAISYWRAGGVLTEADVSRLRDSIEIIPFDWRRLARYSFIIAIICIVISISSASKEIAELIRNFFKTPIVGSIFFAVLSAYMFRVALKRRFLYPERTYSNEATFFLGVLCVAASIASLGRALEVWDGHFSLLLLLAALVCLVLGFWFPSKLVWVFGILSLGSWFGTETGYVSGWGAYWLGMNYPLRFVVFGIVLLLLSRILKERSELFSSTYSLGLLYLFVAIWILSIFGNYGDMAIWQKTPQRELFLWSLLFGVASLVAVYIGLRNDDTKARGFGLTFLFINLYTRYFEYFWDSMHKAIFFALLALSFWLLGLKAERIWNLGIRQS